MDCKAIQTMGLPLSTVTVHRATTTTPRNGSYAIPGATYAVGPLRQYNQPGVDRFFIDSFPLNPGRPNQRVCSIRITVKGRSTHTANNDNLKIFAPGGQGPILSNGQWQNGAPLGGMALTDQSASWTFNLTVSGTGAMSAPLNGALASGLNALDLVVSDDSEVTSANFVYTLY
jgi:hypothetical protein